jgi:hypothetical protein
MRGIILGLISAMVAAGAAQAADFVVVKSTDPAIKAGTPVNGGERLKLAAGQTLVLLAPAGDMTTLKGGASGATAPARRTAQVDASKLESLRVLIDPPPPGRTFGGRRGGVCPDPSQLTTIDDILGVQAACPEVARKALTAYANKAP